MRLAYCFDMWVDEGEAEKMPGEVSWSIVIWNEDDVVMNLHVHRVPLGVGLDLADWTEMGPWIPSGGVLEITEYDTLVPAVLKRLPPDTYATGSFLVVEPARAVSEEWKGLGLETLLLSLAIDELRTPDDCLAVAEPLSNLASGKRVPAYAAIHRPIFEAMGFQRFKRSVWLLTDWETFNRQLEGLRSRFGIGDDLTELVLRGEKW